MLCESVCAVNGDPTPTKDGKSPICCLQIWRPFPTAEPQSTEAPPHIHPALPEPGPQSLRAPAKPGPGWRIAASAEQGSGWRAAGSARPSVPHIPWVPGRPAPSPAVPRGPPPYPERIGAIGAAEAAQRHVDGRTAGRARRRSAARLARVTGMQPRPAPTRPARGSELGHELPGPGLQAASAASPHCRFLKLQGREEPRTGSSTPGLHPR